MENWRLEAIKEKLERITRQQKWDQQINELMKVIEALPVVEEKLEKDGTYSSREKGEADWQPASETDLKDIHYTIFEHKWAGIQGLGSNYKRIGLEFYSIRIFGVQTGFGNLEHLKIRLNDIKDATKNFDDAYIIGSGGFGKVYKADLEHFDSSSSSSINGVDICDLPRKRSTVAIKRINNQEGEQGFIAEIETLTSCKHDNIISLLGFCYEGNGAMILVYEHASKGSLENYLGSSDKMTNLTWVQRLNICLDTAHGLNYIHNNTDHGKQKMIHRDIKSDNILLGDNWKAKIADFGLSKFHPADQAASTIYTYMIAVLLEILTGRLAYDSVYTQANEKGIAPIARDHFEKGTIMEIIDHKIKEETDEHEISGMYTDGKSYVTLMDSCQNIASKRLDKKTARRRSTQFAEKTRNPYGGSLDMNLSDDSSLTWGDAAKGYALILHAGRRFPFMELYSSPEWDFLTKESDIFSLGAVLFDILCGKVASLKLDDEYLYLPFLAKQHYHVGKLEKLVWEDYEIWEPRLPKDYNKIIHMSKCPEIYSTKKKEELYNTFTKGILLQQDKVLLSFDGDGERNESVSATAFTYVNSCPHWWRSLKESRFEKVAEMSDISNLNIEIKTDTQLLSPNIVYGVYLVFKLCDSRKFSSKPMYVNLKYRKGSETLQAYFATQRDENWMLIELYRFLNQYEDVFFKFLLESFSSYYCGDGAIYVEGIEFRAIGKVKHDEIGYLKDVQQVLISNFNMDQVQQLPIEEVFEIHNNHDELFWLGEINRKKLLVLSAKAALYKFSDVDLFTSKSSTQSRFQEVIELLPQQVFYINCTFRSQMLSLDMDTEYVCYLVFKISEQYQGLHNPVKVRDLLSQENEHAESFIYFITPNQLNIHDFSGVPKQRKDGWMEIQVWKFNSTHQLKDDSLSINMKFTSHEGPMSGLIVCGLEFRPL
ncbi:kinase-like domain, phloem protein 2-like protein [Tanacetum coccineum]